MEPIKTNQQYSDYVDTKTPNSPILKNCFNAFWVGGLICSIGQIIFDFCKYKGLSESACSTTVSIVLIAISAIVLGIITGTVLNIDDNINKLANKVEQRLKKENSGESLSEGFVTATLLFCIGAMTITGSIQAGLANDNSILITKAILDFVSAIMLAASLGRGVLLSSISLLITQGLLVILSSIIAPYINDIVINEITCVGSLIIILIGTNLMGITKVKVADFLPAIIYTPVIYYLSSFIINLFK